MALSDLDKKILWSRAAGLCSFPDCRELLIRFSKTSKGFYQIGEMAHVVARRMKGPRGKGSLSSQARDSYSNHIVLCGTCHKEIDKNPGDYPVKTLQRFKSEHEHWVAESLHAHLAEKIGFVKFYSNLLKRIEQLLDLEHWPWLQDNLWRDLAPQSAIDSAPEIRTVLLQTIWPGNRPQLEQALKNVMEAWSEYCLNFGKSCRYRADGFFVSDHFHESMTMKQRFKAETKLEQWSNQNGTLFFEFVRQLNAMVDAVREHLQPDYRQSEGHFVIHDELGYRNGGESIIFRPEPAPTSRPKVKQTAPAKHRSTPSPKRNKKKNA